MGSNLEMCTDTKNCNAVGHYDAATNRITLNHDIAIVYITTSDFDASFLTPIEVTPSQMGSIMNEMTPVEREGRTQIQKLLAGFPEDPFGEAISGAAKGPPNFLISTWNFGAMVSTGSINVNSFKSDWSNLEFGFEYSYIGGVEKLGCSTQIECNWSVASELATGAAPAIVNPVFASSELTTLGDLGGSVAKGPLARGRASEARVLDDLGLPKNTQKVSTAEGNAIPDALTSTRSIEIKDCISVACTRQIRIQTDAARASGREPLLITGERTHVTQQAREAFNNNIIRRSDLGPQP
ncbi:MAG: hypothetical protein R2684_12100 [Pyrinomonadaceae bacterium]